MADGLVADDTVGDQRWRLLGRFRDIRQFTEHLAAPLSPEDQTVQSMPDVSPTKWHLAHTTWFFETFLLQAFARGYQAFHPGFGYLFNSYYEAVGARHPRPLRGLLSRPGVAEIAAYRRHVTAAMERLIETADTARWSSIAPLLELGLNHEQQHQELLLMDIKHVLSCNPLLPAYRPDNDGERGAAPALSWLEFDGGLQQLGHDGLGFAFDNELPRHRVWHEGYRLASRAVTCGEYLAFIEDGGYADPRWWLSDGWAAVQGEGWRAPLYWQRGDAGWSVFTLNGAKPLDAAEPVSHVSLFEAAAFAKWAGKRLPSEAEWERAAAGVALDGNLADRDRFHPQAAAGDGLTQMIGDVWEWTRSPYSPYPGYREPPGAVGEYNGKFMSGQMVLRGGAAVTPPGHIRITYRNFFPPAARWPFTGIRLAEDC